MNILHITNTDIYCDNRILKELDAISQTGLFNVIGIGIKSEEGARKTEKKINAKLITLKLISTRLQWLPRSVKYTLTIMELSFKLIFRSIMLKPEIVHCHDTMVLPAGVLIKMFSNAKLIYDAHELESNKNGQNRILSKATLIIEKIFWPKIDHFISVSDSIIDWYILNFSAKSTSLILNSPLLCELIQSRERYFHNIYKIPKDKLVFVYIGLFGHGRSIDTILKAFSNEQINSHVVFIGYGDLETKIQEFSLRNTNIHLHKPVPHEEVVHLVQNADIGLCLIEKTSLSDYYCLPNKLFEYACAGLPVLASDFPDISGLVEKYQLGKCCSLDTKSIIESVKDIEREPPARIATGIEEIGWGKQAEKLTNAYMHLLEL